MDRRALLLSRRGRRQGTGHPADAQSRGRGRWQRPGEDVLQGRARRRERQGRRHPGPRQGRRRPRPPRRRRPGRRPRR
ncbi:hypothetical protein E4K10_25720 [Streptomyces sp. T1317-0309]|nr:hypothetical protein E4K10_25720 [Streptomyces sp. T1317-0309]